MTWLLLGAGIGLLIGLYLSYLLFKPKGRFDKQAIALTTCEAIGWHDWNNGVCQMCGEREHNPSRG